MICEYVLCGILFGWVVISLYIFGKNGKKDEAKIKDTFYNRLKYYRIYYHDPWKLTTVFISVFFFIVCLLWIFNVFPIQAENANSFFDKIATISATIFIILVTLLVLTVQISVQRYTLDFHRRILLNGWFLVYISLFMFSIFFPLYASGINMELDDVATLSFVLMMFCIILIIPLFSWAMKKTFMVRHLEEEYNRLLYNLSANNKDWIRWQFQEICSISLLAIENNAWTVFTDGVEYLWKAWLKINDKPVEDDFSIKDRMMIFWKRLLKMEEEFPNKFVEIGKKKIENSIEEGEQTSKEKIDIFREFGNIADKENKPDIAGKCNKIYSQLIEVKNS